MLVALFYRLLKSPSVYAILQSEIDTAMSSLTYTRNYIPFAQAQALTYLSSYISKAFRIHPTGGFNLERVGPSSGRAIAGSFIPGGTIVSVST
jgi:hypothetical protein